jgi:hypothetical protein
VHEGIAEEPVETQRLVVILSDFRKLGFDGDLGWRHVEHLHRLLDHVEVGQRRAHHQHADTVVEEELLAGRGEIDARRGEELSSHRGHLIHGSHHGDLVHAGLSRRRKRQLSRHARLLGDCPTAQASTLAHTGHAHADVLRAAATLATLPAAGAAATAAAAATATATAAAASATAAAAATTTSSAA